VEKTFADASTRQERMSLTMTSDFEKWRSLDQDRVASRNALSRLTIISHCARLVDAHSRVSISVERGRRARANCPNRRDGPPVLPRGLLDRLPCFSLPHGMPHTDTSAKPTQIDDLGVGSPPRKTTSSARTIRLGPILRDMAMQSSRLTRRQRQCRSSSLYQ